ncbi:uncharacterized protein LOC123315360 [Coccinella septempunctata]|uniref:uncharacterized protein LOC123315360 n=1 Tax=Coccinella septempunctata TaxID=41139 RepID=UPI001D06776E|nr:uncharacterized protein LOC123315360 [Coccinella septempunctata]
MVKENIIACSVLVLLMFLLGGVSSFPVPAQPFVNTGGIKSDVIVTQWPSTNEKSDLKEELQPGWMKRQLINFGKAASRVGNMMGSHATKISIALDKICEVIKTVIPLLAAVCHVGQFGFCAATNDAPADLSAAISPSMLSELDR